MISLGFSFGKKKDRQSSVTNIDRTTSTDSAQNQLQAQTTQGRQSTSQTGTSSSTGTSATSGTSSQLSQQTQQTQQQQVASQFSSGVLSPLEQSVTELLNSLGMGGGVGNAASDSALGQLAGFDAQAFVDGIVGNATRRSMANREQQINTAQNVIGGTVDGNSSAALLASRINSDEDANLASIESGAVNQAMQILQQNNAAGLARAGSDNALLSGLLSALKGGVTTAATTGSATATGATQNQQQQQTATSEQNQQAQQSDTNSVQNVLGQLLTLLRGTENVKGSEINNTTKSSGGFGLSLGL